MRNIIISFVIFTIGFSGFAQYPRALENTHIFYDTSEKIISLTGNQYYLEDFVPGQIVDSKNNRVQAAWLRYNAMEDFVEMKLRYNEQPRVLSKKENIEYHFADLVFRYNSVNLPTGEILEGFFVEFELDDALFLAKPQLTMRDISEIVGGKDYELYVDFNYFLLKDDLVKEVKLKKKDLNQIFQNVSMQEYLRKNSIANINDVRSLIEFSKIP